MSRLLALTALVLLAGCQTAEFSALTTPPPEREASLDDSDKDAPRIRLSRGVALAFSCEYENKPCKGARASVDGSGRIQVMRTYVDQLSNDDYYEYEPAGSKPITSFVVVGTASGPATLTVRVDGHDYDFDVTVVDP